MLLSAENFAATIDEIRARYGPGGVNVDDPEVVARLVRQDYPQIEGLTPQAEYEAVVREYTPTEIMESLSRPAVRVPPTHGVPFRPGMSLGDRFVAGMTLLRSSPLAALTYAVLVSSGMESENALAWASFTAQVAGFVAMGISARAAVTNSAPRAHTPPRGRLPRTPWDSGTVKRNLRRAIRGGSGSGGGPLPDISGRFRFRPRWRQGNFEYEQISGELGVPGQVMTHRDTAAQRAMSSGTGDHAGHRIGLQFGAPGDARNMGLQNANINTRAPRSLHDTFRGPGGSYLDLETKWADHLRSGSRIEVTVKDQYRQGEGRPVARMAQWTETHPSGTRETQSLTFLNTTSPQSRARSGNQ
jgi:hypothetical protein